MERVLRPAVRPSIGLKRILLPTEHGAWSFLIEPLVVGAVIAPSLAAPWIVLMVVAAFFARQPLKMYFHSRKNAAVASRSLAYFLLFGGAAVVGFIGAETYGGIEILLPLAVAGPLAVKLLYDDATGRGRILSAELFGAAAISSSVAMMAAAKGFEWPAAIGLWLIFVCRFIPSILYVRTRLLVEKGKPHDITWPIVTHLAGACIVVYLAIAGIGSFLTAGVFILLLGRSIVGLSKYRTPMKAMRIGLREMTYGLVTAVSIICGHYLGI
ncbi:MAG: YwiC-like family protein [Pyrinomonadaceae bacterium]